MRTRLSIAAVVVVVLALVLAVTSLNRSGSDDEASGDSGASSSSTEDDSYSLDVDLARHDPDDPMAYGDPDAPVTVVNYSDFRCPFCAKFANDIQPELEKYVENGTMRIEWHDLPIFGEESVRAAVAARAAAKQDKFWEFHDTLYADAPERGHPSMSKKKLIGFAEAAGVPDIEQFIDEMDSKKLREKVRADAQKAMELGASSTPLFLINDVPIVGAQPVEVFRAEIERQADK